MPCSFCSHNSHGKLGTVTDSLISLYLYFLTSALVRGSPQLCPPLPSINSQSKVASSSSGQLPDVASLTKPPHLASVLKTLWESNCRCIQSPSAVTFNFATCCIGTKRKRKLIARRTQWNCKAHTTIKTQLYRNLSPPFAYAFAFAFAFVTSF